MTVFLPSTIFFYQTSKLTKPRILFILGTDRFQLIRPNIKVPNSVFFKVKEGVINYWISYDKDHYGSNYWISMLRILWFKLLDIYVKDTMAQTLCPLC